MTAFIRPRCAVSASGRAVKPWQCLGAVLLAFLSAAALTSHAATILAQTDFGNAEGTNTSPFVSDYTAGLSFPSTPGQYGINLTATGHGRPTWGGVDHTSGTGCFMLVDGATSSARAVVSCAVATQPGSVYTFQGWAQNVFAGASNPAVFRCRVNGIEIGTFSPAGTQTWQAFAFRYTNESSATRVFALHNINTGVAANDFGLDDLVLSAEPVQAAAGFTAVSTSNGFPALVLTNAWSPQTAWVARADNLLASGWTTVGVHAAAATNWTDTSAGGAWSSAFYRIAQAAPEAPWYAGLPRTNLVAGRRGTNVQSGNIRIALSNEQPAVGALWLCAVPTNGAGASPSSDWLNSDGTWDYTRKPRVPGSVVWTSQLAMALVGGTQRVITGNGLPGTPTGTFPVPSNSLAYRYDRNLNTIRTQNVNLAFAALPAYSAVPYCVPFGANGIALSGSAIYHGASTLGTDAAAYEMLDECGGHTDGTGTYHYHMLTDCLLGRYDTSPTGHSAMIGYMMDGFGLFGPRGDDGQVMTTNQLDECHGHTHEIDWDGQRRSLYHYHWVFDFPYNIGCMRGAPVTPWNGLAKAGTSHVHPHQAEESLASLLPAATAAPCDCAPSGGEAVEIAATLLKNVYAAFDARADDDACDALLRSADGELLAGVLPVLSSAPDQRERGSVFAAVQRVDVTGAGELRPGRDRGFTLRLTWTTEALVERWKHRHLQLARYDADVTVRSIEGAWKIVAVRLRETPARLERDI